MFPVPLSYSDHRSTWLPHSPYIEYIRQHLQIFDPASSSPSTKCGQISIPLLIPPSRNIKKTSHWDISLSAAPLRAINAVTFCVFFFRLSSSHCITFVFPVYYFLLLYFYHIRPCPHTHDAGPSSTVPHAFCEIQIYESLILAWVRRQVAAGCMYPVCTSPKINDAATVLG